MSMPQKDRVKLGLSVVILITSAIIYIGGLAKSDKDPVSYFRYSNNPDSLASALISNWSKLPVIFGVMNQDFWDKDLIVGVVFNMHDCGLCLARAHEYLTIVDALSKQGDMAYFCVVISRPPQLLDRYLAVLPKPGPVLRESGTVLEQPNYGNTPKLLIIDRRKGIIVAETIITQEKIPNDILNMLKIMLT